MNEYICRLNIYYKIEKIGKQEDNFVKRLSFKIIYF